jgi:hypothetical protein
MSKRFGSKTLGRVFGWQQSNAGESNSGKRVPESAVPTTRLGTTSAAQQMVDFYSTGIMIIADRTDATLECDPKSGCCEDHF